MRDPGLDDPDTRTIAREAVVYVGLMVFVGLAFVAFRVLKDGDAVLAHDPRAAAASRER